MLNPIGGCVHFSARAGTQRVVAGRWLRLSSCMQESVSCSARNVNRLTASCAIRVQARSRSA